MGEIYELRPSGDCAELEYDVMLEILEERLEDLMDSVRVTRDAIQWLQFHTEQVPPDPPQIA